MGDFLDQVRERQHAPEAIAHRAALFLSSPDQRAVLVESGDDQYFYSALLHRLPQHRKQVEFFQAHGRNRVISALNLLQQLGKVDYAYAIIDKDFHGTDINIAHPAKCLILDVYSFENYFADTIVVKEFGQAFFGLEPESNELLRFNSAADRFFMNVPTSLSREHGIALWCFKNGANCNLANFRLSTCLSVNGQGDIFRIPKTLEIFLTDTDAVRHEISDEAIVVCEILISETEWRSVFRGHYFWTLFVRFFNSFRLTLDEEFRAAGR